MIRSTRHISIKKLALWWLLPGLLLLTAFVLSAPSTSPIFYEDFEGFVSDSQVKRTYTAWQDGARLEVSLDTSQFESGSHSLRIDVLGPNRFDNVKNGSIYRSLPLTKRNWSNAEGISFWIKNPLKDPLWLTFNFKEANNEYWSVESGGIFLLKSGTDTAIQSESLYGNLVIPSQFTGMVTIPISSFSVPDWNSARGDHQLQLSSIESFAFGVTLNEDYPRTFFIDSFSVLPADENITTILGPKNIQIPESGEHRETFSLTATSPAVKNQPTWKLQSSINPMLSINTDGIFAIPAGTQPETIKITAEINRENSPATVSLDVHLYSDSANPASSSIEGSGDRPGVEPQKQGDYEKFAASFETWSMQNRPLFVLISVALVVLFIFILSVFQNKLK